MSQQETTNDPPMEPSHPPPVASSQTKVGEATSKMKRGMKLRSAIWDRFTKVIDGSDVQKGKCNYFNKDFFCDPKKNGTTALRNHMFTCIKDRHSMTTMQS